MPRSYREMNNRTSVTTMAVDERMATHALKGAGPLVCPPLPRALRGGAARGEREAEQRIENEVGRRPWAFEDSARAEHQGATAALRAAALTMERRAEESAGRRGGRVVRRAE
eukprot:2153137-Pyramimonas_sp.AAC.1